MKKICFLAMVLGAATYQEATAQEIAPGQRATLVFEGPVCGCQTAPEAKPCRLWGSAEYMLWWVKPAPSNYPLATTATPSTDFAFPSGAIGLPGTQVLFGGSGFNYQSFSGIRPTLGMWLDCERSIGIEGSGFLLQHRTIKFSAASDDAGIPALYIPIFNVQTGQQGSFFVSDTLQSFAGGLTYTTSINFWGTEFNGVFRLCKRECSQLNLIAGFRYLDLRETLGLALDLNDFGALILDKGSEQFATTNQFYGGQLGLRGEWRSCRWTVEGTAKVALGTTHQISTVSGSEVQSGPGAPFPGLNPGLLFAAPSNIGQQTRDQFSVVPQVQLKLGYDVRPWLRLTAGYDFLYWSNVVRPGDQVDRNISPSQLTVYSNPPLNGTPPLPAPRFQSTDFYAHGITFGLELKY